MSKSSSKFNRYKAGEITYNKEQLVREVQELTGLPKSRSIRASKTHKVVTAMLDVIADALKRGEKVRVVGMGTFYVSKIKARKQPVKYFYKQARKGCPNTWVTIPSRKLVRFRPDKFLKDFVNEGYDGGS